jgi:membrane-associated PAP2 superfamily phosphatase
MKRSRRPGLSEAGWLTLGILGLALAWDASGLDLPFARLAGSGEGFPWRDHWLLADLVHEGGRRLAWAMALALCLGVWWPVGPLTRLRTSERLQLAVSTLLGALAVSTLKLGSHTSCPWELTDFGGLAHYASHWSGRPDGGGGHCFPAGHASSGFSFVAGYFAFRRTDPAFARRWLLAALASGALLGLTQQWRGAHFMSHTLWSAAICWMSAWLVHSSWPRSRIVKGT